MGEEKNWSQKIAKLKYFLEDNLIQSQRAQGNTRSKATDNLVLQQQQQQQKGKGAKKCPKAGPLLLHPHVSTLPSVRYRSLKAIPPESTLHLHSITAQVT